MALVASAAVRYLDERRGERLASVLLLGGHQSARATEVADAAALCASPMRWWRIVRTGDEDPVARLQADLGERPQVVEIYGMRAATDLMQAVLAAFPAARKITPGDGLGVYATGQRWDFPRYDRVLAFIPQPHSPTESDAPEVEVVPRRYLVEAIEAVHRLHPALRQLDGELADFVRGGTIGMLGVATESQVSTLRQELRQSRIAIQRVTRPRAPVLLKPHPRASLGQAATLARQLRAEGHAVRILPSAMQALPIEIFPQAIAAADGISLAGLGSTAITLKYLYDVDACHAEGIGPMTILPSGVRYARRYARYQKRLVAMLPGWDGEAIFPPFGDLRPSRALAALERRTVMWVALPTDGEGRPGLAAVPKAARRFLGAPSGEDPIRIDDAVSGLAWLLPPETNIAPLDGLGSAGPGVEERVRHFLTMLAGRITRSRFCVLAPATAPSHWPGWQVRLLNRRLLRRFSAAPITAERLEELLDAGADVLVRAPELHEMARESLSLRALVGRRSAPASILFCCELR